MNLAGENDVRAKVIEKVCRENQLKEVFFSVRVFHSKRF